jgi:hypothetical protein
VEIEMTSYDVLLDRVGARINQLPRRSIAALFLACSIGLLPALDAWTRRRASGRSEVFDRAARAARDHAVAAVPIVDGFSLLDAVGAAAKETTTAAQDCWICLDAAIRAVVDEQFKAGPCIEYALEPKSQAVSERLFGVVQVGSGPGEAEAYDTLLADPEFRAAVDFVEWAVARLEVVEAPSSNDIEVLVDRADAIAP